MPVVVGPVEGAVMWREVRQVRRRWKDLNENKRILRLYRD